MPGKKKRGKGKDKLLSTIVDLTQVGLPEGQGWRIKPTTPSTMQAKGAAAVERVRRKSRQWALRKSRGDNAATDHCNWQRETHVLPRLEALKKTRAFFRKRPKSIYQAEIESWRVLEDERVEFTLRYLPVQP